MASSNHPSQVSSAGLQDLSHLSTLLHLFHHRNKNQHRRSIWYRHFSTFRKQLDRLVEDQRGLHEVPTTNLARAQKRSRDAQLLATTAKRLDFWRDVMVARWQHAFSQLIADGRFSVLGLVLMAALAQTCQIVGVTAELEDLGQMEIEKALVEFGREEWAGGGRGEEDVGEVVIRRGEDDSAAPRGTVADPAEIKSRTEITLNEPSMLTKRKNQSSSKPVKKKRKKTGNAIDDIFG